MSDSASGPHAGLIVAWAMLKQEGVLHALVDLDRKGTSVITACNGRWEAHGTSYQVWPADAAPREQRCELCERTWVDQQFVNRGLRELCENAFSRVGIAVDRFARELGTFNPADRAGFEHWLGPCAHGSSPVTRCALGCAPQVNANHDDVDDSTPLASLQKGQ